MYKYAVCDDSSGQALDALKGKRLVIEWVDTYSTSYATVLQEYHISCCRMTVRICATISRRLLPIGSHARLILVPDDFFQDYDSRCNMIVAGFFQRQLRHSIMRRCDVALRKHALNSLSPDHLFCGLHPSTSDGDDMSPVEDLQPHEGAPDRQVLDVLESDSVPQTPRKWTSLSSYDDIDGPGLSGEESREGLGRRGSGRREGYEVKAQVRNYTVLTRCRMY